MKIESLKVFRDLAETKSFTRAAEVNEVTQSAVSQQVSMLEGLFKAQLVERGKRKFRLSSHGEVLYDHSRQILQIFGELEKALLETKERISSKIRVATIYSIGLHALPQRLGLFRQRFPDVKVSVDYRPACDVYQAVLENDSDLGLVAYPIHHRELESIALPKDPLVLICHPSRPLAKRKSVKLKALNAEHFVGLEKNVPTRRGLDRLFKDHGAKPNYVQEFDNIEAVKQAVEIDLGVAVVPQSTIAKELATRSLAAVRIEGDFGRPQAIIHTKYKALTPVMKQFVALFKETK